MDPPGLTIHRVYPQTFRSTSTLQLLPTGRAVPLLKQVVDDAFLSSLTEGHSDGAGEPDGLTGVDRTDDEIRFRLVVANEMRFGRADSACRDMQTSSG